MFGGDGAVIRGDISLTAGATLEIVVGGEGGDNAASGAGGGGASFVYVSGAAQPLVVAGGGGGASFELSGEPAQTGTSGSAGEGTGAGATGGSQISTLKQVGAGGFGGFISPSYQTLWSDGSPTATDSAEHGYVWANNGIGAGYSFTVPAGTTSQTLYVYCGGFSSGSTLTASLSDGIAPNFTDTFSGANHYSQIVAITFSAASANQTLTITYTKSSNIAGTAGSADLIAAGLVGPGTMPHVGLNPISKTVTAGSTVSFTASATGSPVPTVQWQISTDGGSHFTNISGANSTTYSFTAALGENGDMYQAVFTNSNGFDISSPATLMVTAAPTAVLTGIQSTAAASYNLTAQGTTDWAHWGLAGNPVTYDHKATGGSQISNITTVGTGGFGGFNDPTRTVSWTDGTPVGTVGSDHGYVWANNGIGAGYSVTVPAGTTEHTLYVYLGGYSSGSTFTAHLSGGGASDYVTTLSSSGHYNNIIAITFQAASAGQTLTLTYVKSQNINGTGGSSDLIAAWLQ